jgi:hypothetical protein
MLTPFLLLGWLKHQFRAGSDIITHRSDSSLVCGNVRMLSCLWVVTGALFLCHYAPGGNMRTCTKGPVPN